MERSDSRRILIVDDNIDLAENIAEILQIEGHATEVAGNAEEAQSKAVATQPDVVITDYRLPDATGTALLRQLRAAGLNVRAIVISAYTDDRTVGEANSAGAAFVPKPVDFAALGPLIRERDLPT